MRAKRNIRGFTPLEILTRSKTGGSGALFLTGFTLVETITASVILCGAVLAVGAISTRSLGETRLNRQYEVAAALADRQRNRPYSISVNTMLNGTGMFVETE